MSAVSLSDACTHLGLDAGDPRVQTFIDAAEADITQDVGPLVPTSVTVTASGRRGAILLPVLPFIGPVTAATNLDTGQPYANLSELACTAGGALTTPSRDIPDGAWRVTYTAGRATLPANLKLAVLELTAHLFKTQRSGTFKGQDEFPGTVHARPWRVSELMESETTNWGIA